MSEFNWSIRIPILKNRVIRNQLSLAIGIPFGVLCIVLLAVQAYSGLAMVGGALALGFLLVLLIFRGTYDVQFALDDKGIKYTVSLAMEPQFHIGEVIGNKLRLYLDLDNFYLDPNLEVSDTIQPDYIEIPITAKNGLPLRHL